ncbi:MAG: flagellar hook-length control protein FliK [Oscillospiraceae bacterium]|jgi:hypothetical protein|nr:flagellar hook-length control protein FliK [Oscillospiraceae bacterium]
MRVDNYNTNEILLRAVPSETRELPRVGDMLEARVLSADALAARLKTAAGLVFTARFEGAVRLSRGDVVNMTVAEARDGYILLRLEDEGIRLLLGELGEDEAFFIPPRTPAASAPPQAPSPDGAPIPAEAVDIESALTPPSPDAIPQDAAAVTEGEAQRIIADSTAQPINTPDADAAAPAADNAQAVATPPDAARQAALPDMAAPGSAPPPNALIDEASQSIPERAAAGAAPAQSADAVSQGSAPARAGAALPVQNTPEAQGAPQGQASPAPAAVNTTETTATAAAAAAATTAADGQTAPRPTRSAAPNRAAPPSEADSVRAAAGRRALPDSEAARVSNSRGAEAQRAIQAREVTNTPLPERDPQGAFFHTRVPMNIRGERREAELYFRRGKKGRRGGESSDMLLSLELPAMGKWEALVSVTGHDIAVRMKTASDGARALLLSNTDKLAEILSESGFNLTRMRAVVPGEDDDFETLLTGAVPERRDLHARYVDLSI